MERNPPWQRDELILALDLYFKHNPLKISKAHPEVVALSKVLNALPVQNQELPRSGGLTYAVTGTCNTMAPISARLM